MQRDSIDKSTEDPVTTVLRLGFLLADPIDDYGPHVIDWNVLKVERRYNLIGRPSHDLAAA